LTNYNFLRWRAQAAPTIGHVNQDRSPEQRFNAVAHGVADTPMHCNNSNESALQPTIKKATVKDAVDAVLYLAQASHVSGEILHVDGAAPPRRW